MVALCLPVAQAPVPPNGLVPENQANFANDAVLAYNYPMPRHNRPLPSAHGSKAAQPTTQAVRRRLTFYLCRLSLLLLAPYLFAQNTITTVAGTEYVFSGDGKPALSAPLGDVASVTLDTSGNPVFSDPGNAVVIRVNPNGLVTVLAGNGIQGFSGDGGPATSAALNSPQGVAFDAAGNLYIADTGNDRIRMVTPSGVISTIAGNSLSVSSGDGGPAVQASFSLPIALAVDSSNIIYISDLTETSVGTAARIRRIAQDGTISTLAGNGQAGSSPDNVPARTASLGDVEDIALDAKGNLYLADFSNNKVRKIDTNGILTTLAGDGQARFFGDNGPAAKASLYNPGGVFVDSANNVYISDTNNSCIRKVDAQGTITTIAGVPGHFGFSGDGASALNAVFEGVFGLVVDSGGNLFVTDTDNNRLRKIQSNGIINTVAGNGAFRLIADGTLAANAFLFGPQGVSIDGNGNTYVADTANSSVRKITRNGVISTIAGNGSREYSGDNGPATHAGLASPVNVTPDGRGGLYIADTDNEVIRKVAADGTISTVAGNGTQGYGGDNGPATQASLSSPQDVIWDSAGNLYVSDFGNNAIRRVATNGVITTIAGNPKITVLNDGGSALQAGLSRPRGLAFDAAGNLYVADAGNLRIRRISTSGTITTVAGGGSKIVTATPIPATQAFLGSPQSIVVDGAGNLYFSDAFRDRVYEVSASTGNIAIVAGNGNIGYSGDGGPATQAALNAPSGLALDASGNLLIADTFNNRIREILVTPPALNSSPASLTFSAKSGGGLTDPQTVSIDSSVPGLLYTLAATTTSGGQWLKAAVSTGTIPATVQIQADPTGLDPGTTYQGAIVVSAPNANPTSRTVAVTFAVSPSVAPQLGVGSAFLTYSFVQGASPFSQALTILNQGGGSLAFSASTATDTGGNWLTVSPASGAATPVQSAPVSVQADPTGLDVGTYSGTVTIAGASSTINVPVTMTVSAISRKLLLSQTGLKSNAVFAGGAPLAQSFAVLNAGQGDLNWTVQATTLTGADSAGNKLNWLVVVTPTSGVSTAGADLPPLVSVAIDASNLSPGEYYGQIQVFSTDADNSPQTISVVLDVLSTGSDPGPEVRPTGLVFTGAAGSSPGSQNVFVSNLTSATTSYASGRVTQDGQNWFVNAPTNAVVAPNQPLRIVVQPDFTNLAPGTYNGVLTLLFNGGVVRTVNILSVVTGNSSTQSADIFHAAAAGGHDSGSCSPKTLNVQIASPDSNSNPQATQPVSVQVKAFDDCGAPMQTSGKMSVSFSNNDPGLDLIPNGNGVWTRTWQPQSATPSQVRMLVTAFETTSGGSIIGGQSQLSLTIQTGGTNPVVSSGVQNSASFVAESLAPLGGLISVFGKGLADGTYNTPNPPYDTQLGGTQVFLDNAPLALLYASDGQINAQAPYILSANIAHQLRVQRNGVPSIPVDVNVAPAQPGIFTLSANGSGQGFIYLVRPDGSVSDTVAGPAAPASAGDTVLIYCTGLGLVAPSVNVGTPAPSSPAVLTVSPVLVSIGGKSAQVLSATLAPNNAGKYQVVVVVPAGVPPSDQVPVVLTVANQPSPATATMAVH
jgi:uncharacterized protein (TIGR03437 family)